MDSSSPIILLPYVQQGDPPPHLVTGFWVWSGLQRLRPRAPSFLPGVASRGHLLTLPPHSASGSVFRWLCLHAPFPICLFLDPGPLCSSLPSLLLLSCCPFLSSPSPWFWAEWGEGAGEEIAGKAWGRDLSPLFRTPLTPSQGARARMVLLLYERLATCMGGRTSLCVPAQRPGPFRFLPPAFQSRSLSLCPFSCLSQEPVCVGF